jgi:hypothetical protein
MPVFGPLAVKKMFPDMLDVASQMVLKWDRQGSDHEIEIADDFTISLSKHRFRINIDVSVQDGFRHDRTMRLQLQI